MNRSASFFALGRIKKTLKPVAVITTSGSAVVELFPACMEAYYSGLPLVMITADRPSEYRGSGAPQSIEQANIFKNYVGKSWDLSISSELPNFRVVTQPIHINVCFGEPLLSGEVKVLKGSTSC